MEAEPQHNTCTSTQAWGMILSSLFGYYGSPSLSQLLGYSLYLVGITLVIVKTRKMRPN